MSNPSDRTPVGTVAAVILAAGRSRRMPGRSKLLRQFRGEAVIRSVAGTALESALDPVIVCVASASRPVVQALADLPVFPVPVPPGPRGRIVSVAVGLSAVRGYDPSAALILLGDEPGLDTRDIEAVRAAWIDGAGDLLRARFRDRPGHPVLIARSLFDRVIRLARSDGEGDGLWQRLVRADIEGVEVPIDPAAPIDVDSPSALEAARSLDRR